MLLSVILVVVGDDTPQPGVVAVGMGDRAVEGVMSSAVTVITAVKLWAMPSVVGGIGDLAVEALVGGGRARRSLSGFRANVGSCPVRLYPSCDVWAFFSSEPGHRVVEVGNAVA